MLMPPQLKTLSAAYVEQKGLDASDAVDWSGAKPFKVRAVEEVKVIGTAAVVVVADVRR